MPHAGKQNRSSAVKRRSLAAAAVTNAALRARCLVAACISQIAAGLAHVVELPRQATNLQRRAQFRRLARDAAPSCARAATRSHAVRERAQRALRCTSTRCMDVADLT